MLPVDASNPDNQDASREDANQGGPPPDASETGYPIPRSDLVAAVGGPDTLDVATWNLETFPLASGTVSLAADVIQSLDLDLIAIQEISDIDAFDELVTRLPQHDGFYAFVPPAEGFYQKVGFIYREDILTLEPGSIDLLFTFDGYAFPRPPMQARFSYRHRNGQIADFTAISVHLKASGGQDNIERRNAAMSLLAGHMQDHIDGPEDDDILLLGDINHTLDGDTTPDPFSHIRDSASFSIHTTALHQSGAASYIPWPELIDHIIATSALDDEFAGMQAVIPRLDLDPDLSNFTQRLSDHLPVIASLPVL